MESHVDKKLKQGKWIAVYPYGYTITLDDNGEQKVIIDPVKSLIVKKCFEWYASEDYSLSMIEDKVKKEFKIPLSKARIENILRKKFYYGVMEAKGKEFDHSYGSLISKELYDAVQLIMKNRRGTWKPKI